MPNLTLKIDRKRGVVTCTPAAPKPRTIAQRYRDGVEWIAFNDEPSDRNPESVAQFISTLLLADLFDKTPETVAAAVIRMRRSRSI